MIYQFSELFPTKTLRIIQSILGIKWKNTAPGTDLPRVFCPDRPAAGSLVPLNTMTKTNLLKHILVDRVLFFKMVAKFDIEFPFVTLHNIIKLYNTCSVWCLCICFRLLLIYIWNLETCPKIQYGRNPTWPPISNAILNLDRFYLKICFMLFLWFFPSSCLVGQMTLENNVFRRKYVFWNTLFYLHIHLCLYYFG